LAEVTLHLWKERKITGLFLSSSVLKDPDYITEKQLQVLRTLRKSGYTGYIHLRIMPGVSRSYLREAIELSDRVGVNLEAPNKEIYNEICPDKGGFKEAILKRLEWIVDETKKARNEAYKPKFGYGKAGVDTQMIVGAVHDDDWHYLQTTEWLYKKFNLKRVYYSGFEPLPQTPLEDHVACSPSREYRLYQSSFLLRDYGFTVNNFSSILDDHRLLPNLDPKLVFAKTNPDIFPINLNTATYHEIVQIPHIGPITAKKIIKAREEIKIQYAADLERIIGANFTRRVSPYVELKDKRLTEFQK
jgi:predicted DNA-binding helix-hairpin-helix protein